VVFRAAFYGASLRGLYNGRSYGQFERVITLPEAVGTDEVQAELRDGVLRIDLPNRPESRPKKIALKTNRIV
jgi:HSP20 family molecular chaperone IbpA